MNIRHVIGISFYTFEKKLKNFRGRKTMVFWPFRLQGNTRVNWKVLSTTKLEQRRYKKDGGNSFSILFVPPATVAERSVA